MFFVLFEGVCSEPRTDNKLVKAWSHLYWDFLRLKYVNTSPQKKFVAVMKLSFIQFQRNCSLQFRVLFAPVPEETHFSQ